MELFEEMPEVGDPDKPKLVFFFDEAHLLFKDAPRALLQKVEQVVRLIRWKGVGVYFLSSSPHDIPESVSRLLGNRIQHALRSTDRKGLRGAAMTLRANPTFNTEEAIIRLGSGEALVSTMNAKDQPSMIELTMVKPPLSRVGPITAAEGKAVINASPVFGEHDNPEAGPGPDSAYAILQEPRTKEAREAPGQAMRAAADQGDADAQVNLGLMYKSGHGVPRDVAQAIEWFRLAANQGNAKAQDNLRAWASGARRW